MTTSQTDKIVIEGEIALWIDQGAVHLKLIPCAADPVELTSDSAKRLGEVLFTFAARIDAEDAKV